MPRNPPWERDELILALDLYFRVGAGVRSRHPDLIELSETLRQLPIHNHAARGENFRSPDSVHLKLQNFLAIDPKHKGKGLPHGGRAERKIWSDFEAKRDELSRLAVAIREGALILQVAQGHIDEEEEFPEGKILYRLHRIRERNPRLVKKLKTKWLENYGRLICQVCGFDFEKAYGTLGRGYIECHHNVPVSELTPNQRKRLQDLSLVCANCHRVIHRRRPWVSVAELSNLVKL